MSCPSYPVEDANDIIVVEQKDGSFTSSPWNVNFGKFQRVLKTTVSISVNGVEANFHMDLDSSGKAYFPKEVEATAAATTEDSVFSVEDVGLKNCHLVTTIHLSEVDENIEAKNHDDERFVFSDDKLKPNDPKTSLSAPSSADKETDALTSNDNIHLTSHFSSLSIEVGYQEDENLTPTSSQLASLGLKAQGSNITFTISTANGKQQETAKIYFWKYNEYIVISDVDGTITRSDVLGQVIPMVEYDWNQIDVANSFSVTKENGYQLLFLCARSISQSHLTQQISFNLKQDGKMLLYGPVVVTPDGLFPSLFQEEPHISIIACLENIRALYPPDVNPFYYGFGNRDADEISYLRVNIPEGIVFIINSKGDVAINRIRGS